ncbi:DUF397 domain-containing protein [Streptomyces aidingensis]|uniref:DUF397 domain-containing protein n=1 Tax=Streptomyces aidingensis TaxID=910347 RepID=A0A1I1HBU4_9ACTN|nr:DUF397 domain-containing protein [Streptomyces aidingensis]SFC21165.1 protein of unknown function [Streptomyces aidingensis]
MTEIHWQKSSFSTDQHECVEIGSAARALLLRESEAPGAVLVADAVRVAALLRAVRGGALGRSAD